MKRSSRTVATAAALVLIIGGMVGLTAASVPLYRLFCQVTGYGGTTQLAEDGAGEVLDQTIKIRFNADVDPHLPWAFGPDQREIEVKIGENSLAFYHAENRADHAIVGAATYNVTPHKVGPYFSKIACFCFDEQTLAAGEAVEMPVSFYVDPAILDDPNTRDVTAITLSYTFFKRGDAEAPVAGAGDVAKPAS
jgi:cytochrome c oxidase assembly protein subunit 11